MVNDMVNDTVDLWQSRDRPRGVGAGWAGKGSNLGGGSVSFFVSCDARSWLCPFPLMMQRNPCQVK